MGQLAKGPSHRALPAPLRAADISQKPVPGPAADEARQLQERGHRRSDQAASGSRSLGQAEPLKSQLVWPSVGLSAQDDGHTSTRLVEGATLASLMMRILDSAR